MISLFITSLFLTFFSVRAGAHFLHDMDGYGTKNENSKTITGFLRKKTGFDWHHFHIGIILLFITLPLILMSGLNNFTILPLAIGISLVIDQATPIINRKTCYFHIKNLLISISFHLIIALMALFLFYFNQVQ